MTRVCCVFGTWQVITLAAALRQASVDQPEPEKPDAASEDILLVYETSGVTQEFKDILDRMARAAWPWKRIVWAYDLLTNRDRISSREYTALLDTIRERVGVGASEVDELWVCWLTRPAEKLVFEAFPSARIVLYEDGLISYIPIAFAKRMDPALGPPPTFKETLRRRWQKYLEGKSPVWRFLHSRDKLDPRHLLRVSAAYLQLTPAEPLPDMLTSVPRQTVKYSLLREVLDTVALTLGAELTGALHSEGRDAAPSVLVLGQALSRNGIMSRDQEKNIYCSVTDEILAKGYRVLWKEHPRVSEPFFGDLKASAETKGIGDRIEQLSLPNAYPIELVASRLRLVGCVAGSSAALFYLRRLYGTSCYTFGSVLVPYMEGVDVFMADMVRREAAPLAELGPAERMAAVSELSRSA